MANFPVKINGRNDITYFNETEGRFLNTYFNNLGGNQLPNTSATLHTGWMTATKPSVSANTWSLVSLGGITPSCGRKLVINKITMTTLDPCQVALMMIPDVRAAFTIAGGSVNTQVPINLVNASGVYVRTQSNPNGGDTVFDFSFPLVLRGDTRLDFYQSFSGTTGTNWQVSYEGYDLTDDDNFDAPYTMLVLGDSICGFTTDPGAYKFNLRDDGTITGSWTFILQEKLRLDGIDTRQINIGIGGTTAQQWDWYINNGRISTIKADIFFVNLGMNDCSSVADLSTGSTVDGRFKIAMKNIISTYYRKNPNGTCIVNNITDSDDPTKLTLVSGGTYNGLTRIAAYRQEIINTVSDLKTKHPNWDILVAPTNTAYSATTQPTYFILPQTAGTNVHPNTQLGQPAMAAIQYSTFVTTNFWQTHRIAA